MILYLAGPMTGYPDANRAAFHEAARTLTAMGHSVLDPACNPDGLTSAQYAVVDDAMISVCDCVVLLDGWEHSVGVEHELYVAEDLDKQVRTMRQMMEVEG